MIGSRVLATLLREKPSAVKFIARRGHVAANSFRNPYPRAGPNPFGEPEWFFNPVHYYAKRFMTALVIWVIVDVRYLGQYRANNTPFTIEMINTLFPSIPARYQDEPHKEGH